MLQARGYGCSRLSLQSEQGQGVLCGPLWVPFVPLQNKNLCHCEQHVAEQHLPLLQHLIWVVSPPAPYVQCSATSVCTKPVQNPLLKSLLEWCKGFGEWLGVNATLPDF